MKCLWRNFELGFLDGIPVTQKNINSPRWKHIWTDYGIFIIRIDTLRDRAYKDGTRTWKISGWPKREYGICLTDGCVHLCADFRSTLEEAIETAEKIMFDPKERPNAFQFDSNRVRIGSSASKGNGACYVSLDWCKRQSEIDEAKLYELAYNDPTSEFEAYDRLSFRNEDAYPGVKVLFCVDRKWLDKQEKADNEAIYDLACADRAASKLSKEYVQSVRFRHSVEENLYTMLYAPKKWYDKQTERNIETLRDMCEKERLADISLLATSETGVTEYTVSQLWLDIQDETDPNRLLALAKADNDESRLKILSEPTVKPQWIQIWYSWGDQESPVEVPANKNAWDYMAELARKEARIELTENEPDIDVMLQFSNDMNQVTLHYADGQRCTYYRITDAEDWDPDMLREENAV